MRPLLMIEREADLGIGMGPFAMSYTRAGHAVEGEAWMCGHDERRRIRPGNATPQFQSQ